MTKQQKLVAKIHRKFETAQDEILARAKEIIASPVNESKAERLSSLGFHRAKPVSAQDNGWETRSRSEYLIRLMEGYVCEYPNHKFITEDVVNKICAKYGLVFSTVSSYIGDVPDKNVAEMEAFIKDYNIQLPVSENPFSINIDRMMLTWVNIGMPRASLTPEQYFPEPHSREFKICAPEKDFDTAGKVKKGYELVNDPIVLYPVRGGYIIVTKWGLEANDPDVINEKMN